MRLTAIGTTPPLKEEAAKVIQILDGMGIRARVEKIDDLFQLNLTNTAGQPLYTQEGKGRDPISLSAKFNFNESLKTLLEMLQGISGKTIGRADGKFKTGFSTEYKIPEFSKLDTTI